MTYTRDTCAYRTLVTHSEFIDAYKEGRIRVNIDRAAAARYMSARLLLPFVMLPVLGAGVALALVGWVWSGLTLIALGTIAPMLIKRSAPHFIMTQALQDEAFFDDVTRAELLSFEVRTADG